MDVAEVLAKVFENEDQWMVRVPIELTYFDLFSIVGNIQLALRHPQNNGPSSDQVREIARQMAERMIVDLGVFTPELLAESRWVEELGVDPVLV